MGMKGIGLQLDSSSEIQEIRIAGSRAWQAALKFSRVADEDRGVQSFSAVCDIAPEDHADISRPQRR